MWNSQWQHIDPDEEYSIYYEMSESLNQDSFVQVWKVKAYVCLVINLLSYLGTNIS